MLAAVEEYIETPAASACLRRENAPRLMNLWDILKRFKVAEFAVLIAKLTSIEDSSMMLAASGKGGAFVEEFDTNLKQLAEEALVFCRQVGFSDTATVVYILSVKLNESEHFNVSHLETEARNLRESLLKEAHARAFVVTPKQFADFIDNAALFGEKVQDAFPSAKVDIREVGNCIAVESSTAAVFHLMRVAEYGLRALAKTLRVRLTHAGRFQPIEFADWDKVITGIKNEIAKARSLSPAPKRQAKLERYSDAADHCLYMKDIWRNNISHARKPYSQAEALAVMGRVRDFMTFLATHLKPR